MTAQVSHEQKGFNGHGDEPVLAQFPNGLRSDGLADTYFARDGSLMLVPYMPHDYGFTTELAHRGLTRGQVTELHGRPTVRYPADADLIGLPAIMNAAILAEDGRQDIVHTIRLVGEAARRMKHHLGAVPMITSIEGIAVDRTTDMVELLPPYQTTHTASPEALFRHLRDSAYNRSRGPNEQDMIATCFRAAYSAFTGVDE